MSSAITLYRDKVFLLAKTVVIKHKFIAQAINDELIKQGYYVDYSDPTTWKYYLNLNGQYHQYDKDQLSILSESVDPDDIHEYMRVKVAGDNGPIDVDFNKLLVSSPDSDPATANEYRYGAPFYNELVSRYPGFEDLILGIINPIDINIAIDSYDGEILYCGDYIKTASLVANDYYIYQRKTQSIFGDTQLVEDNEYQLIYKLQEWVNAFLTRWINIDFVPIEDLYIPTMFGIMYMNIPQAVFNIRQSACKSSQAHSFHVKSYLDSHGYLGWHQQHLALPQIMWLYRNVEWLEANMGTARAFQAIIDNILTPSNVPLSGFQMLHDNSTMPDELVPRTLGYAVPLNLGQAGRVSYQSHTIREMLDKEVDLAKDNAYSIVDDAINIEFEASRGRNESYGTKLLESVLIDYSNFIPFKVTDILLNMWAYCIAKGTYRGIAYVTHPRTGDRLQFTMMNAFILMVYCFNKGYYNIDLENIMPVTVRLIPRETSYVPAEGFSLKPTFQQLRDNMPFQYIRDDEIVDMMGTRTPKYAFANSTAFFDECEEIWMEANRQWYLHDDCPWLSKSMYRANMMRRLYWWNMKLDLPKTGTSYESWFTVMNLDLSDMTQSDYLNLMVQLFMYGTGYVENAQRKMKAIQRSCVELLKHFCSYGTHVASDLGSYAPEFSRDTPLKIDDIQLVSEMKFFIPAEIPDIKLSTVTQWKATTPVLPTFSQESIQLTSQLKVTTTDFNPEVTIQGINMGLFIPLIEPINQFVSIDAL